MTVNPSEIEALPNLHTLRLGRINNLKEYIQVFNRSVRTFGCYNLESEWIEEFHSNLQYLRVLELSFQSHDLHISNLANLDEILIDYFCWGEIKLSNLEGLQ